MSENSLAEKIKEHLNTRNIVFFLFTAVALIMAYTPIKALYSSNKSEYYSHIALIPLVSIYLIYIKRKEIFAKVNYLFVVGIPVLLLGIALFLGGFLWGAPLDKNNYASLIAFSIFIFINGAFILLYGMQAYRSRFVPSSLFDFYRSDPHGSHGQYHLFFTGRFHGVYKSVISGLGSAICERWLCLSLAQCQCRSG